MSTFNLGARTLKRFVLDENTYAYFKAKLTADLFKGEEKQLFEAVDKHFTSYQTLPKIDTLLTDFPFLAEVEAPEPSKYYVDHLTNRFAYDTINRGNLASQDILKVNKNDIDLALSELEKVIGAIRQQQYRARMLDLGLEGPKLVLGTYFNTLASTSPPAGFGWPYMDEMSGGCLPGDVVSFVGRPAMGKSWFMLFIALYNWTIRHLNVLFVSMEMNTLAIAQRCTAMYAGTNISQLKLAGYSSSTFEIFNSKLEQMKMEQSKFYVMDGNLAASASHIYGLAQQLGCNVVCIDGAYLVKHTNTRLDRYTRVAENVELFKQYGTELELPTFASWQFNRDALKKDKKAGQKAGLEDIGYSDAIGQVSSIVCGLMQEEGVETLNQRWIDVLKGRNGEIGKFAVNWLFDVMNFTQLEEEDQQEEKPALSYV